MTCVLALSRNWKSANLTPVKTLLAKHGVRRILIDIASIDLQIIAPQSTCFIPAALDVTRFGRFGDSDGEIFVQADERRQCLLMRARGWR